MVCSFRDASSRMFRDAEMFQEAIPKAILLNNLCFRRLFSKSYSPKLLEVSNNIICDCPLQNKRFKKTNEECIDGHVWFRKMVY